MNDKEILCIKNNVDEIVHYQEANYRELNKFETGSWEIASTMLGALLANGYMAKIVMCENSYIIEYDWRDPNWSGRYLVWLEDAEN